MKKYKVLLVTVTYKPNRIILTQCLDSINKYNDIGENLKIVVVDNSPRGESIIPDFKSKYSNILFIEASENKGFGYSNNIGAMSYDSDYLLFFNNDTEFSEPILRQLINNMEQNDNCGLIGIKQANKLPSFFKRNEVKMNYLLMKYKIANYHFDCENFFLSGAFLFFRRKAFVEAGMFDSNIFMYMEESDISNRIMSLGYSIIFDKSLSFIHKTGDRSSHSRNSYILQKESYLYYMKKYGMESNIRNTTKRIIREMQIKSLIMLIIGKFNAFKNLKEGINIYKDVLHN